MAGVDSILSEAYEKAKIEVFGDSFAEQESKWIGSVTFLEYLYGTAKHYAGATGRVCKSAVGMKTTAPAEDSDSAAILARAAKAAEEEAAKKKREDQDTFSPMDMLKGIRSSVDALATDMHDLSKHLQQTREIATYATAHGCWQCPFPRLCPSAADTGFDCAGGFRGSRSWSKQTRAMRATAKTL
jgi:hypothetical protein